MSLQAKWAWTGGAATAVMDLEGQGVGGGTVATKTAHELSRLDKLDKTAVANLVALQLQSAFPRFNNRSLGDAAPGCKRQNGARNEFTILLANGCLQEMSERLHIWTAWLVRFVC